MDFYRTGCSLYRGARARIGRIDADLRARGRGEAEEGDGVVVSRREPLGYLGQTAIGTVSSRSISGTRTRARARRH